MKMEVRVFTASPILVDEISDWFKGQEPRIPITVSVVEREGESRVAVYALFLDAPVVTNVAIGDPVAAVALGTGLEKEALDMLQLYYERSLASEEEIKRLGEKGIKLKRSDENVELTAKTAELLKKAGRA